MKTCSLKYLVEACGGWLREGAPEDVVQGLCTDSRLVKPGDLFIALKGDNHDAHQYLGEVIRRGAAAVLVEKDKVSAGLTGCAVLVVEDTRKALGLLARAYRQEFQPKVIAVGGSNGKTSVKELVAALLRQKYHTLWSEASFNNDIGVPLTLLQLEAGHEAAVIEVGSNHPGELAPLLDMVQPWYGIVTSIGREHMEHFKDIAGVVREEGFLGECLPAAGRYFVNTEHDWVSALTCRTRASVVRVGWDEANDYSARNVRFDDHGGTMEVRTPQAALNGEYGFRLLGRHQALNALLALAVGGELGLDRAQMQRGLLECSGAKMRLQLWQHRGIRVLDDAYNANPDSMRAALETLSALSCAGRRVAVLGDMAELGEHAEASHREVGRRAAGAGLDHLFAVGRHAGVVAAAAREAGLPQVTEAADVIEAGKVLKTFLREQDLVLLKASRSSGLERIGQVLRQD